MMSIPKAYVPLVRFLTISVSLYLIWYIFYEFYLKPGLWFDDQVINLLVRTAEFQLRIFGLELTDYTLADGPIRTHIGLLGSKGVTIGAPCDGLVLYALFVCFIVAYPGPWRHKAWFLPLGVFFTFLFNTWRIIALALIVSCREDWLSFNHDYTFTILVYAFVFAWWYVWVNRFAHQGAAKTK